MADKKTPYADLNPNVILNAIESTGFNGADSLFALNSYENRVYQVGIQDAEPLIVKFYRPYRWSDEAIIEEHQFSSELASYEIPVVAPLADDAEHTLHHYQNFRFALFPRQGARTIEFDNLEHLEWMGRFIARIHAVGACKPFQHRLQLDAESYGYKPYHFLIEQNFIPPELLTNYCNTVETVL
ncbi:MAG: serine/threonine protein kinase, partial [Gammaproteobacteria bacterium]